MEIHCAGSAQGFVPIQGDFVASLEDGALQMSAYDS